LTGKLRSRRSLTLFPSTLTGLFGLPLSDLIVGVLILICIGKEILMRHEFGAIAKENDPARADAKGSCLIVGLKAIVIWAVVKSTTNAGATEFSYSPMVSRVRGP
jgi:hypothetical protein